MPMPMTKTVEAGAFRPRPLPLDAGTRVTHLLFHLAPTDTIAVACKRTFERGNGVRVTLLPESKITEMFVHRRARRQLLGGLGERRIGQIQLALAEVGPSE